MDISGFHRMLKAADAHEIVAAHLVPTGVVSYAAVRLVKVTDTPLDELEITWHVIRSGNPDQVVISTEDEAAAHRVYADQVDQVVTEQAERTMWRR